jgi:hypothetical protein
MTVEKLPHWKAGSISSKSVHYPRQFHAELGDLESSVEDPI